MTDVKGKAIELMNELADDNEPVLERLPSTYHLLMSRRIETTDKFYAA